MGNELQRRIDQPLWEPTQNEVDILMRNIKVASNGKADVHDAAWLINVARATGLNPIKGQICLIITGEGSKKRSLIYVTLAGYLRIAMDSGQLEAIRTVYYDEEGVEHKVFPKGKSLWACQCLLKLKGSDVWTEGPPIYWSEFGAPNENWGEYKDRDTGKIVRYPKNPWAKTPFHMARKTALSHVLREQFPDRLSGIYTEDELSEELKSQTISVVEESGDNVEKQADTPPPHPKKIVQVEAEAVVEEPEVDEVQEELEELKGDFEGLCVQYSDLESGEIDWLRCREALDTSGAAKFPWAKKYPAYKNWTKQHFILGCEVIEDAIAADAETVSRSIIDDAAAEVMGRADG